MMDETGGNGSRTEAHNREKESSFNQVYQEWTNMNPWNDSSMVGTDEYRQVRQEVVGEIENVYQKFLEENGPVNGINLRDYFTSWIRLVDFTTRQDERPDKKLSVSYYDLGYRFMIDALLNDEKRLSNEEIEAFRQYFMDRAPFDTHLEFHSEEKDRTFLESYLRKESFQEAVSLLYKKSTMLFYFGGTHPPASITEDPDWKNAYSQMEPAVIAALRGRYGADITAKFDPRTLLGGLIYQIVGKNPSKYNETIRVHPSFQVPESEFLDKIRADFEVGKPAHDLNHEKERKSK